MLLPAMTYWDTEQKIFVNQTIMQNDGEPIASDRYDYPKKFRERDCYIPSFVKDHTLEIKIKLLNERAQMPTRSNPDDAGMDIYAAENVTLQNRFWGLHDYKHEQNDSSRAMISTGLSFEIPQGLALFVWDRSGLLAKNGSHRVAGVPDSCYRGELKIALVNLSNKPYEIKIGDRIAQAIISPIILPKLVQVDKLSETIRGEKGFGSSGV